MTVPARRPVRVLAFLGAAGTVTGSRFVVETADARVLVDCGLFQGLKELRRRNWRPFPVAPTDIDAMLLTHAHVDHSGWIPKLVVDGFQGEIHATDNTIALCEVLLPDSGRLHEEEAAYAGRYGYSKHEPPLPLYTEDDARASLGRFRGHPFDVPVEVVPGITATFHPAGHILGAAGVTLDLEDSVRVHFSGDLGRPNHPVLRPPAPPTAADVIVVESTYGDRRHDDTETLERFRDAVARTAARRGVVVIPAFAVDRTEVILFHLRSLMADGSLPAIPVVVDSPMALAALSLYRRAMKSGAAECRSDLDVDGDPFDPGSLSEVHSVTESKAVNDLSGPLVIVSASGMATGGRVLHHLARRLGDARNTVLLVGYQAAGTRGRALLDGARTVKMLGRHVPVSAEIVDVPGFSVHADADDLVAWLASAPRPPQVVYVVHGEPDASTALGTRINSELAWTAVVPHSGERVLLP
ncbi:MAG: MBL fold metallo-hydrolase [Acidimicrobiia bacterium]|nr:MBL fold metallo-hydrolase [Acidimicrobiia bacterium]